MHRPRRLKVKEGVIIPMDYQGTSSMNTLFSFDRLDSLKIQKVKAPAIIFIWDFCTPWKNEDDTSPRRPCSSRTKWDSMAQQFSSSQQALTASGATDRLAMWHLNTTPSSKNSSFHRRSDNCCLPVPQLTEIVHWVVHCAITPCT